MREWRVLIAAAGKGSRAGLPYPKTLYPIQGRPILARILDLVKAYDDCPTVVVSQMGEPHVQGMLSEQGLRAHLVQQAVPKGMGDAVMCWRESPGWSKQAHVILIWGDVPFIQPATLEGTIQAHVHANADFTFATRHVGSAYTVVHRDEQGRVCGLIETREEGAESGPAPGERDIGLFVFDAAKVLPVLEADHPKKFGRTTGEHGFLYLVGALVERGLNVQAVPIATELDLVSLNSIKDIEAFL